MERNLNTQKEDTTTSETSWSEINKIACDNSSLEEICGWKEWD